MKWSHTPMFGHLLLQFYLADMFFDCKIKCGKKNNFAGLNGNIFVQDFKIANMTTTSKSLVYSSHVSKIFRKCHRNYLFKFMVNVITTIWGAPNHYLICMKMVCAIVFKIGATSKIISTVENIKYRQKTSCSQTFHGKPFGPQLLLRQCLFKNGTSTGWRTSLMYPSAFKLPLMMTTSLYEPQS